MKRISLINIKCFFPQFIDLILAGFILTNPGSSRDYFLNETLLQKKKKTGQNQDCLVLPHASYGPALVVEGAMKTKGGASLNNLGNPRNDRH